MNRVSFPQGLYHQVPKLIILILFDRSIDWGLSDKIRNNTNNENLIWMQISWK